jgi:hypothetical protein
LINLSSEDDYKDDLCFVESWELVYLLINGQNGKYKQKFRSYIDTWEKRYKFMRIMDETGIEVKDKTAHLKLFEQIMGITIDELEKEWKEYVLSF